MYSNYITYAMLKIEDNTNKKLGITLIRSLVIKRNKKIFDT